MSEKDPTQKPKIIYLVTPKLYVFASKASPGRNGASPILHPEDLDIECSYIKSQKSGPDLCIYEYSYAPIAYGIESFITLLALFGIGKRAATASVVASWVVNNLIDMTYFKQTELPNLKEFHNDPPEIKHFYEF